MAVKKTIELNVNATQAEKALDKFGGTLEDVYGEGVQPLNFAIGELEDRLYEMAAAGDTSSQAFKDMSEEVGRMKKTIIDVDMVVDGLSQTTAQNLGGAIGGLASGFELAQGAMGAFGVESAAVEETLLKVQSAMAISQGIQGIKESIASFKGLGATLSRTAVGQKALNVAQKAGAVGMRILNTVMKANPVFLLIGAFGALAGAVAWFASDSETAAEKTARLNDELDGQLDKLNQLQKAYTVINNARLKQLELEGAKESELLKKRQEFAEKENNIRKATIKAEEQKIRNIAAGAAELTGEEFEEAQQQIADLKASLEEKKLASLEYQANRANIAKEITLKEAEENKKQADEEAAKQKERLDKWKQYQANRLAARRQIEDLEQQLDSDEIEQNNIKYDRLIEDTKANENLLQQEKLDIIKYYNQLRLEEEKNILKAQRDEFLNIYREQKDKEREIDETFLDDIDAQFESEIEKVQIQADAEVDIFRKKEESKEYLRANGVQMATNAFTALGDLANAFAGESEKAQKRAFNINKAVGIANAIINTAEGVTKAFTLPAPASFIVAATTAAAGAAQIATIAKTKFDSSGGGASGGSSISVPSGGGSSAPTFNVVGNTGTNQLAETLGQLNKEPVKAYVTSGDMTTAQSLDRNKIESATL